MPSPARAPHPTLPGVPTLRIKRGSTTNPILVFVLAHRPRGADIATESQEKVHAEVPIRERAVALSAGKKKTASAHTSRPPESEAVFLVQARKQAGAERGRASLGPNPLLLDTGHREVRAPVQPGLPESPLRSKGGLRLLHGQGGDGAASAEAFHRGDPQGRSNLPEHKRPAAEESRGGVEGRRRERTAPILQAERGLGPLGRAEILAENVLQGTEEDSIQLLHPSAFPVSAQVVGNAPLGVGLEERMRRLQAKASAAQVGQPGPKSHRPSNSLSPVRGGMERDALLPRLQPRNLGAEASKRRNAQGVKGRQQGSSGVLAPDTRL